MTEHLVHFCAIFFFLLKNLKPLVTMIALDMIIEKKIIIDGESDSVDYLDKNIERKLYFIEQFLQVLIYLNLSYIIHKGSLFLINKFDLKFAQINESLFGACENIDIFEDNDKIICKYMINTTDNIKNIFVQYLKSFIATKKLSEKKNAIKYIYDQFKVLEVLQNYLVTISLSDIYLEFDKKSVNLQKTKNKNAVSLSLTDKIDKLNKTIKKIKTFMKISTNPINPQNRDILSRELVNLFCTCVLSNANIKKTIIHLLVNKLFYLIAFDKYEKTLG